MGQIITFYLHMAFQYSGKFIFSPAVKQKSGKNTIFSATFGFLNQTLLYNWSLFTR